MVVERGIAEDALEHGLEDGEAAAGYADVDFDGGPDEGAGVGVGAVGEGDGGDGVGAQDADAADAGFRVCKYVCEGVSGGRVLLRLGRFEKFFKGGRGKTYKAPTANTALSAIFLLMLICSCHTIPIGSSRIAKSMTTFGTAEPIRYAGKSIWWYPLGKSFRFVVQSKLGGEAWKIAANTTAMHQPTTRANITYITLRNNGRTPKSRRYSVRMEHLIAVTTSGYKISMP